MKYNTSEHESHVYEHTMYTLLTQYRGITALVEAVRGGHGDIVRVLLDRKADPNLRRSVRDI